MKKLLFIVVLSTLVIQANAFDLQQAVQSAMAYDTEYSSAQHRHDASSEQVKLALAPLLPQVNVSGQYTYNQALGPVSSHGRQASWQVQLSQVLFNAPRLVQYQQGIIRAKSGDNQLSLAKQKLILKVAGAYFSVLQAQENVRAVQGALKAYRQHYLQAKEMFRVGSANSVDVYEAKAGLDGAIAREQSAKTQLLLAQNKLNTLTNLPAEEIQPIVSGSLKHLAKVGILPSRQAVVFWQHKAQENNEALRLKKLAWDNAKLVVKGAMGGHLPSVYLNGTYSDIHHFNTSPTTPKEIRGTNISVSVNIPLFSGGATSANVYQAKAQELASQDDYINAQRELDLKVKQDYLTVADGWSQLKAQNQLLQTQKAKLEATKLGHSVGARSMVDWVNAQQAYLDSVSQMAQARYHYLQARLALAQDTGSLGLQEALSEINLLFTGKNMKD